MGNGPVLKILFIGDVVGKGGRKAVKALLPELKHEYGCTFSVVNAENSAGGAGITSSCLEEMPGADVFTAGDHTWDQKNFETEISRCKNVLRPANFSSLQPGRGWGVFRNPAGGEVAVISLLGKVFMKESAYCPFETIEKILPQIPASCTCIVVDFHAEATSEKLAMGHFLDGKATAVIGTHTHVQTADARILPGGTAMLTDAGMTGGNDSILGRSIEDVIRKFRTGMPTKLTVVEKDIRLDACIISYEMDTGKAIGIKAFSRIYHPEKEIQP